MYLSRLGHVLLILALLACPARAHGQQPDLPRTDAYGDPLPAGALVRIGSYRFKYFAHMVAQLAFSPDCRSLAVISSDIKNDGIRLFDLADGRELRRFGGYRYGYTCLVFAADGKTLFAAGHHGGPEQRLAIRQWEVATGKEIRQLIGHDKEIVALRLVDDGKKLVSLEEEGMIRSWDVVSGKETARWQSPVGKYQPLDLGPDGTTVALVREEGVIELWDAASGSRLRQFKASPQPIERLVYSPDGRMLAAIDDKGTVQLRETATGLVRQELPTKLPRGYRQGVAFAPDSSALAVGNGDLAVLWDIVAGKESMRFKSRCWLYAVAFSPDGKLLVGDPNGRDESLQLWRLPQGQPVRFTRGHRGGINTLDYSPDGKQLLATSADGAARFWDPVTGKELGRLDQQARWSAWALAPEGRTLAAVNEQQVLLLDRVTQKEIRRFPVVQQYISVVDFSPDGKLLLTYDTSRKIHLWDVATGKAHPPLPDLPEKITRHGSWAWSPDGKELLVATGKILHFWETATGKYRSQAAEIPEGETWGARYSPDGKTLAVARGAGQVGLYDPASGKKRHEFGWWVRSLAFSPDSQTIALGYETTWTKPDHVIRLFDVASGKEKACLAGHQARVWSLAFSPDGRQLASGGDDTTILIWDLRAVAPAK